MRKFVVCLLVLLSIFMMPASAQPGFNDFNNYSRVEMHFELFSNFSLVKESSRARVDSVAAELSFVPLAERQSVQNLVLDATPKAQTTEGVGVMKYFWSNPTAELFQYREVADVTVQNMPLLVTGKVPYPIQPVYNEFTQASEMIDISPEIAEQARVLAEGEDDLFVVATKMASWVEKNIKYDLTTLTAPVVQKSSWVFQNREGVCDELTNLFISMMRSRGIPVRYVAGVAYSNVGNDWGPHAWAEVYFPNVGWVPFDVTYGQFGWLDPSHIRLKASADSGEASVKYTWKALDVKFKSNGVRMDVDARQVHGPLPRYAEMSVRPLVNKVGPGSYVPVEVTVKNTQSAYLPVTVVVTKAQDLTERNMKHVLLLPGQEQKVYWLMRVPRDLDAGFNYFSLVEVQDQFHYAARTNVTYGATYKVLSEADAKKVIEGEAVEGTAARFLDMDCEYREYAFSYEAIPVQCAVKNTGDTPLYDVKVCLGKACQTVTVPEKEARGVRFVLEQQPLGLQRYEVLAENKDARKIVRVFVNVLENPDMIVTNFQVPEQIRYGDAFQMSFVMQVKAPVKDVRTLVNGHEVIAIPSLVASKKLIIKTDGSEYVSRGEANITIEYKDENDRLYSVSNAYPMRVTDVPFFIRILRALRIIG